MRLIDARELFYKVGKIKPRNKEHYKSIGEFMHLISNSPTIDAVEVVRCKDCKFGVYEKGRGIYHTRCEILEFLFQDDDYCSYGEKKDEF